MNRNGLTDIIRKEAERLGVIICPPECKKQDDRNMVFLYLPEDAAYNDEIDLRGETAAETAYRNSFWSFPNADFSDPGRSDFCPADCTDLILADIRLAYMKARQDAYVRKQGGYDAIRTGDGIYNGINVGVIEAMKQRYGTVYLGKINGRNAILEEYTGQLIHAYCCDFAVPEPDAVLVSLIATWRTDAPFPFRLNNEIAGIVERINQIRGTVIIWF